MKRGLIITLYKGSRKYDDNHKNYRGISLLPVLAKLFDKVLLNRNNEWIHSESIEFPSTNQSAYQQNLCSLFDSFAVQEKKKLHMRAHYTLYRYDKRSLTRQTATLLTQYGMLDCFLNCMS